MVTLVAPDAGGVVKGDYRFRAQASDSDGVAYVAYWIDGQEVARDSSCCDWAEKWNSRTVPNGNHTLVVRAEDARGAVSELTTVIDVRN